MGMWLYLSDQLEHTAQRLFPLSADCGRTDDTWPSVNHVGIKLTHCNFEQILFAGMMIDMGFSAACPVFGIGNPRDLQCCLVNVSCSSLAGLKLLFQDFMFNEYLLQLIP